VDSERVTEIGDDIKATADDIATDARRVHEIETEKSRLSPDDPRLIELANESEALTAEMAVKAKTETALVESVGSEAPPRLQRGDGFAGAG
jgi:hypothetical protein